jgi:hypothetical protein
VAPQEHILLRLLPVSAIFRAVLFSLLGLLILLPSTTGLLVILKQFPASFNEVMVFKTCYGAVISILSTPFILIGAMADKGGALSL